MKKVTLGLPRSLSTDKTDLRSLSSKVKKVTLDGGQVTLGQGGWEENDLGREKSDLGLVKSDLGPTSVFSRRLVEKVTFSKVSFIGKN